MAELASGRDWEELVRETLFDPLAMSGAGFGPMVTPGHLDGLWAHSMRGTLPVPVEPGPHSDNPLFRTSAGSVHVTLEGWGHFIIDMLRGFGTGTAPSCRGESYEHLHHASFGGNYAYGWGIVQRSWADGAALFAHPGASNYNFAAAWVAPKRRFAVLVATNVGSDEAARAVRRGRGHADPAPAHSVLKREIRGPPFRPGAPVASI